MARKKTINQEPKASHLQYGEAKKVSNYTLTPTAIALLKQKAAAANLSASEFVERMARELAVEGDMEQMGKSLTT